MLQTLIFSRFFLRFFDFPIFQFLITQFLVVFIFLSDFSSVFIPSKSQDWPILNKKLFQ